MPGSRRGVSAGAEYAFIGFLDLNGNLTGGTPTAPANGTASDLRNVLGIKSVPSTTPTQDVVQSTGDDTLLGEFPFDSIATRLYTATTAAYDMDLNGYLSGSAVAALGDGLMGLEDMSGAVIPDTLWITQARTKKQDVGVEGKKAWSGFIEPLCTTTFLGRDAYTERAAAVYNWSVTPQLATQAPWGVTLASHFTVASGRRIPFTFDNPIAMTVLYGNASLAIIPVRHQPISAAKVFAYTIPAGYSTGGVAATVSSVSTTAPYTVTLSVAPATGSKTVIVYEFQTFVKA